MKKLLLLLLYVPLIGLGQQTYVPDDNFEQELINLGYDNVLDDYVTTANIDTIQNLNVEYQGIFDLTGIEDFISLKILLCDGNGLTNLDLSNNIALTNLDCSEQDYMSSVGLANLNISNNIALSWLECQNNALTSLNVSNNTALTHIKCYRNQLTNLDVSNNVALSHLECFDNQLTSLDVSNNTDLIHLNCHSNQFTILDFSNNIALNFLHCFNNQSNGLLTVDISNTAFQSSDFSWTFLQCSNSNGLSLIMNNLLNLTGTVIIDVNFGLHSLTVNNNLNLDTLICSNHQLTFLSLINNPSLTYLNCNSNSLTSLDLNGTTALTDLICSYNQLTSLFINNATDLIHLQCGYNSLTSLDISDNTNLMYMKCRNNSLTSLDVSNNISLTDLVCNDNQLTCLDISSNSSLTNLTCSNNLLEQLNTKNGNWQQMNVSALSNNLTCVEVDNIGYASNNWNFDAFTTINTNCNYVNPCITTNIQDYTVQKDLLKVTDILGRYTEKKQNTPLFYIYNDGTVEKKIVIE